MFFEHARSIVSPRSQSAIMIGVIVDAMPGLQGTGIGRRGRGGRQYNL
jgi:hypothetical protein